MNSDGDSEQVRGNDVNHFERNRFFHGKLMTARDMQAEQDYHVGRLNTLNRLVVGKGIVRGLDVSVRDADDKLEVEVEPGVALDGAGRLIVVDSTATERLPAATEDEVSVFIAHDEASKDRVPVQGSDRSYEEECTYNRILETFELYYQDGPSGKSGGEPEDGSGDESDAGSGGESTYGADVYDAESARTEIAEAYHGERLAARGPADDSDVFLGSFERTSDGWEEKEGGAQRQYVYTNDMLYDVLIDHVTDRENPHGVSFEGADIESAGELQNRMDDLEQRVDQVEEERSTLERYVMNETLEDKIGAFHHVETEFDSGTAEEIVAQSRTNLVEDSISGREDYVDFTETILERESALEQEIKDEATEESMDRYSEALAEMRTTLEDLSEDDSVVVVAEAQKKVCSAAESLVSDAG